MNAQQAMNNWRTHDQLLQIVIDELGLTIRSDDPETHEKVTRGQRAFALAVTSLVSDGFVAGWIAASGIGS